METIRTPKWVYGHLQDGEEVISAISGLAGAKYYATSRRLLRLGRHGPQTLEYGEASVDLTKYGPGVGVLKGIIVLFGLLFLFAGVLTLVQPDFLSPKTTIPFIRENPHLWQAGFFALIGLVIIYVPLQHANAYYQLRGPDFDRLSPRELKGWRIERRRWGGGAADRFANLIKEKSGDR
jgi:hypothetical protein